MGSIQVYRYKIWFGGDPESLPPLLVYLSCLLPIYVHICSTLIKHTDICTSRFFWYGSHTVWSVRSRNYPLLELTKRQVPMVKTLGYLGKKKHFQTLWEGSKENLNMFGSILWPSRLHLDMAYSSTYTSHTLRSINETKIHNLLPLNTFNTVSCVLQKQGQPHWKLIIQPENGKLWRCARVLVYTVRRCLTLMFKPPNVLLTLKCFSTYDMYCLTLN